MPQPTISCLVVSRSAELISRLMASLVESRQFWQEGDEILCSWNGTEADEQAIDPHGLPFRIAQRTPYHFASNVNQLADHANGDILAILNDDLILDPGSLDRAVQVLNSRTEIGLVGGKLRHRSGRLTHAGLLLDREFMPYNRLRPDRLQELLPADALALEESGAITAVTGALMVLRRSTFEQLQMRTTFRVCGEDVAYCLDLRTQLQQRVWIASDVTGIHDEKTTRGKALDHFDRVAVAHLAEQLEQSFPQLRAESIDWVTQEADLLEQIVHQQREEIDHLRQRVSQLDEQLESSQAMLEAREDVITQMRNSIRWRLLHPRETWRTLVRLYGERRSHHNSASGRNCSRKEE